MQQHKYERAAGKHVTAANSLAKMLPEKELGMTVEDIRAAGYDFNFGLGIENPEEAASIRKRHEKLAQQSGIILLRRSDIRKVREPIYV